MHAQRKLRYRMKSKEAERRNEGPPVVLLVQTMNDGDGSSFRNATGYVFWINVFSGYRIGESRED